MEVEAAIIRNGGGRTSDALRSILDLDALGAMGTVIVIHHTGKRSFHYLSKIWFLFSAKHFDQIAV
jgi:hypothetical protein